MTNKQINTDKALIPNAQIEEMFFRISNDHEVQTYIRLAEAGRLNLATAYASKRVHKKFMEMLKKLGE